MAIFLPGGVGIHKRNAYLTVYLSGADKRDRQTIMLCQRFDLGPVQLIRIHRHQFRSIIAKSVNGTETSIQISLIRSDCWRDSDVRCGYLVA